MNEDLRLASKIVQKALFQPLFCISIKIVCSIVVTLNWFAAFVWTGKKTVRFSLNTPRFFVVLQSLLNLYTSAKHG